MDRALCFQIVRNLKACPPCRRKVRLSPKTATVAVVLPFSATVALFCDSVDRALRSLPFYSASAQLAAERWHVLWLHNVKVTVTHYLLLCIVVSKVVFHNNDSQNQCYESKSEESKIYTCIEKSRSKATYYLLTHKSRDECLFWRLHWIVHWLVLNR